MNEARSIYNKIFDQYEQLVYSEPTDPDSITNRYNNVFSTLDLKPGLNVLELGAGNGVFTVPLAIREPKASIYALDVAEKMLFNLREKLNSRSLSNVNIIHGDYEHIPILSEEFDIIFYSFSLHYAFNPITTIKDATRVLKPNGKLVVLEIGGGQQKIGDKTLDSIIRDSYKAHAHYYDKEEVESFLKQCNLKDVNSDIVYIDSWDVNGEEVAVPLYTVSGIKK